MSEEAIFSWLETRAKNLGALAATTWDMGQHEASDMISEQACAIENALDDLRHGRTP